MNRILRIGTASALALATAVPAAAQSWRPTEQYQQAQQAYQSDQDRYQDQQDQYRASREHYRDQRAGYAEARRDYDRRLADWETARARYDARWGEGAYARRYPRPYWDEAYWSHHAPFAESYGQNATANIRCSSDSAVAGGVIGAIAGAVLGSNIAARNARPEGAVLGGVLGAAVGAGVGHAHDRYKCDKQGPYFSYSETIPYREGRDRFGSDHDYAYYEHERCRLAAAPVDPDGHDMRYVRVCPDDRGRYRITG